MMALNRKILVCVTALGAMWLAADPAVGQGSIYGAVNNSDMSVPDSGLISFYGYLDDTDEEIRIESSVGAGYDAGFWFDDFQNYITESPGNPYDYHFFNLANGEGQVLSSLIPDNSFQQEDILLSVVSWPAAPENVSARFSSATEVEITWQLISGLTYRVYRREVPSTGSFFRIDEPTGALADYGVEDSVFLDTDVFSDKSYDYLVVAVDSQGRPGLHSAVVTAAFSGGCCVYRGDIDHSGALPLDISDLVYLINFMFGGGPEPLCQEEADVNADGADLIDISDLVFLIDYMFVGGETPSPCL